MGWVTTASIVVTAGTVAAAFAARRREPELFIMALATGWCWLICHALKLEVGAEFRRIYPLTDLGLAVLALSMMWSEAGLRIANAALWKSITFACLSIEMCLHPLFPTWLSLEERTPYLATLNALYWTMCATMAVQAMRGLRWRQPILAPAS